MDWPVVIKKNQAALMEIIALLLALAGLEAGGRVSDRPLALPRQTLSRQIVSRNTLSRQTCRAILHLLRPAESALRRLIVIAARGIQLTAPQRQTPLPDFADFGCSKSEPVPLFRLYDPRKRFDIGVEDAPADTCQIMPRISVPGLIDPARDMRVGALPDRPINSAHLIKRLRALEHAARTLPKQARRLARSECRRRHLPAGPGCVPPMRPGAPPGSRKRRTHPVDDLLIECHNLAHYAQTGPP
mgnify:FL=1